MARLNIPARDAAPAKSQPLLDAVARQLGSVPNLFLLAATSPAALEGLLGLNGAVGHTLDVKTRERIALAVAQTNGCDYCLAAHNFIGLNMAKLDEAEIARNRAGHSADERADAALRFAVRVVETRGKVSDDDLAAVRAGGFDDAGIVEIVANVTVHLFTNYLNNVARTDVDFPPVAPVDAA